jgi:hypothetical protein
MPDARLCRLQVTACVGQLGLQCRDSARTLHGLCGLGALQFGDARLCVAQLLQHLLDNRTSQVCVVRVTCTYGLTGLVHLGLPDAAAIAPDPSFPAALSAVIPERVFNAVIADAADAAIAVTVGGVSSPASHSLLSGKSNSGSRMPIPIEEP